MCEESDKDDMSSGGAIGKGTAAGKGDTTGRIIENLRQLGMGDIDDNPETRGFLADVTEYRLMGYVACFKDASGKFEEGATFAKLKGLYRFDSELRKILFRRLERIEVAFRTRTVSFFSARHMSDGYLVSGNFSPTRLKRDDVIAGIKKELEEYGYCSGGYPPFDVAAELVSFGKFVKFYAVMTDDDERAFCSKYYGRMDYVRFRTWMACILEIRNRCAHHEQLCGVKLNNRFTVNSGCSGKSLRTIHADSVFGVVVCMKSILGLKDRNGIVRDLEVLFDKYPDVDRTVIGFPSDWKKILCSEGAW